MIRRKRGMPVRSLLIVRDSFRKIYADYDVYIRPVLKFVFALLCILSVNFYLGYMPVLCRIPVVLIGALICSVTPAGTAAFISAVFVIGHLSEVSVVSAGLAFLLIVLIAGLFLGFRPGNAWLLALIPLAFMWNVPFFVPVVLGLASGGAAVVASVCAIPVWFLMEYVHGHVDGFTNSLDLGILTTEFKAIADGFLKSEYMYIMILMFVIVILLVSVIKRLPVDHAWTIAILAGIAAEAIIGIGGGIVTGGGNLLLDLVGILVSLGLALLYEYLFFGVDYRGTEKLQFEDDDYYYYVKAVPKIKPYEEDERFE